MRGKEHEPARPGEPPRMRRRWQRRELLGLGAVLLLASCSAGGLGSRLSSFGDSGGGVPAAGRSLGTGPVRVALLLPLSGDPALAAVGTSLANAAELAIDFIAGSDTIPDNITIVLKDTGPGTTGAAQATSAAVAEGASLILGPLKADQVTAAGAVARSAGIPLIGFSNNSGAAAPGVYLLNVLPETEVRRSLGYARAQGRRAFAGVFSTSDFGRIHEGAFRQAVTDLGLNARAVYSFSSEEEARGVVQQLAPLLKQGQIDALFLPDRATAPSLGVLLQEAGVAPGAVQIIGSADWNGDARIIATPGLAGAIYPAVDDAGYQALLADYQAKFAGMPHALATIAYTAVVLANASSLALATPPYQHALLTLPNGFNGRDGVFRFLPDGRSEYALVIKQVTAGGAVTIEGPKL